MSSIFFKLRNDKGNEIEHEADAKEFIEHYKSVDDIYDDSLDILGTLTVRQNKAIELFILRINNAASYYADPNETMEMYWIGKDMTRIKFLEFQTIWNTFFSTYQ
jgi:hypothetical protein